MGRSAVVIVLVLVAVAGIAMSKNGPKTPARCLAHGACKAHAPACLDSPEDLFTCDPNTGAWTSNYTHIPHDMTFGGPVVFLQNLTVGRNANITFNESREAFVTFNGWADFREANETWSIRVHDDDVDKWAEVEAKGSTDFSASERRVVAATHVYLPSNWKLKIKPGPKCHVPYILDTDPDWDTIQYTNSLGQLSSGTTFYMYFYTKSQCWWWIVLVGTILAYFAFLVLTIVAFKTVPALKAWTTLPIYDTHVAATNRRATHSSGKHLDNDEYELDNAISKSSRVDETEESDEGDSVALDI